MLPSLEQEGQMDRFPFEGKGLQQVETQAGVVVHLPEQLLECFSSNITLPDDLEKRVTSVSGSDSNSDMNAALGASSVLLQEAN